MNLLSRRQFLQVSTQVLGGVCFQSSLFGKIKDVNVGKLVSLGDQEQNIAGNQPVGILGSPTENSIACNLLSDNSGAAFLEYGLESVGASMKTEPVEILAGVPIRVQMNGLLRNSKYNYRLQYRLDGSSQFIPGVEHSFFTCRDSASSFRFTINADPHNLEPNFSPDLYRLTLTNVLADKPDFHINLGDTFMTEKHKARSAAEAETSYINFRQYVDIIGSDMAYFLVNGNHEGELGWLLDGTDQNLAVWCTNDRKKYFPVPEIGPFYTGSIQPEPFIGIRDGYYAWNWGCAQFIVLDPFWYTRSKPRPEANENWGWTLGEDQYRWLETTLSESRAAYKFVFIHHLVGGNTKDARGGVEAAQYYEWGGKNDDGSWGFDAMRPAWGKPIHLLLVENKVNIVFHGHDHVFVKQDLDGVIYQECPQPDVKNYKNEHLAQEYGYIQGNVVSGCGHLRVSVSPGKCDVEFIQAYLPKDETGGQANGQVGCAYSL
jgi:hypothetical protein